MTDAITLIKTEIGKREEILNYLSNLKDQQALSNGVSIEECYVCFGWPDFVLLLRGNNVELLKNAIIELRNAISSKISPNLETSTIICTTYKEIKKSKETIKEIIEK